MKPSAKIPSAEVLAAREDIINVLKKHDKKLSAMEILALLAHMVGQVIAAQDQETVTPQMAMDLVAANIEQGNAEAIASITQTVGNA